MHTVGFDMYPDVDIYIYIYICIMTIYTDIRNLVRMYIYIWLAGCMEFVWVHVESFLHSVASPFHSFVTNIYI